MWAEQQSHWMKVCEAEEQSETEKRGFQNLKRLSENLW